MAVLQKRSRLVSFRLSELEYEALQNFTASGGARSLSDFARSALCEALEIGGGRTRMNGSAHEAQDNVVNQTLERLVATMEELNRVMSRLSVLMESTAAHEVGR